MKSQTFIRVALATALCSPSLAFATNGYFLNGYGAAAQGVAGVGIALPQDALAAANNPAGIAFVGNRVDGDISLFLPQRSASISGNQAGFNGQYTGDNRSIFALPEFGVTYQVSPNIYAGLALYANGGLDTGYAVNPFKSIGGSGSAGVDLEQVFLSPTIAYKLFDRHAFGLGLNIAYQRFTASGLQPFEAMSVAPDNVTNQGADSTIGVGVHLGYTGQITPALMVGATWASKIHGRFNDYSGLFANGGSFDIPENYGFGVSYKVTHAWTVAADFQRILYGNVDSIANPLANLTTEGNLLGSADGPGFGWRNTNVIKIGTTYQFNSHLMLRAGYSHSSQPVATSQTLLNVIAPGVVQDQATVGATWTTSNKTSIGFFFAHAFGKTVSGANAIPASFGGGSASVHLMENEIGLSLGKQF